MNIQEAANRLLDGDLVVFPTETVYGIGALASNTEAVKRIFEVKGRPAINPLIVHIAENEQLQELVSEIPETAKRLIERFWPGPLTICFQKSENVPDIVTAGLPTVCVRMPDHEQAQQLLRELREPLAAPSANLSGRPSTTTFEDAKRQLAEKGVHFLDGGSTPLGIESTVVDCSRLPVRLLRPGAISQKQIEEVLGESITDESTGEKISSPGQLLDHYAPQGHLTVLSGTPQHRREWIRQHGDAATLGYIGTTPTGSTNVQAYQLCEAENEVETYTARLYEFLNWCDLINAKNIVLELPSLDHPLLPALINRLEKASRGKILRLH